MITQLTTVPSIFIYVLVSVLLTYVITRKFLMPNRPKDELAARSVTLRNGTMEGIPEEIARHLSFMIRCVPQDPKSGKRAGRARIEECLMFCGIPLTKWVTHEEDLETNTLDAGSIERLSCLKLSSVKASGRDCHEHLADAVFRSPSVFGRLVAVCGLRKVGTGRYHHPLAADWGADEVDEALRRMHREVFQAWLGLQLEEQERDVSLWLDENDKHGTRPLREIMGRVAELVPAQREDAEHQLFVSDLRIIVSMLNETDAEYPSHTVDRASPVRRLIGKFRVG